MLPVLEEQMIFENRFDTYFADKTYGKKDGKYPTHPDYTRVSWLESKALQVKMRRFIGYDQFNNDLWYYSSSSSSDCLLTGIGTGNEGWTIPDTLLSPATYSFKFRVLPEERLIEHAERDILWFGRGTAYRAMDANWIRVPLFRVIIDPYTNHLFLYFGGRANYTFGEWTYDLGHVDDFLNWTNFTIWMDLEAKTFKKLWIGREIPFPEGYEDGIKVNNSKYHNEMYNGMYTGVEIQTTRPYTNIMFEIDDVEVWVGYHPPGLPPWPPGWEEWLRRNLWWLLALGSMASGGVMIYGSKKRQERGR